MVVRCWKIKIQLQRADETEARRAVRRTGDGRRKGEVECVWATNLWQGWWWWWW